MVLGQSDQMQQFQDAAFQFPAAQGWLLAQGFGNDVFHKHARVERGRGVLKHHLEPTPDVLPLEGARGHGCDIHRLRDHCRDDR